ncbi:hypothetical protein RUM43_012177 [Polyplax serrata]|uniref:Uncharacterized protein n=1 Tax=Polyplax serrata TaxID=468196 RepID=A0AAN8RZ89_POLSC
MKFPVHFLPDLPKIILHSTVTYELSARPRNESQIVCLPDDFRGGLQCRSFNSLVYSILLVMAPKPFFNQIPDSAKSRWDLRSTEEGNCYQIKTILTHKNKNELYEANYPINLMT